MHLVLKNLSKQNGLFSKRSRIKRAIFRKSVFTRVSSFLKKTGACIITTILYTGLTALFLFLFKAESYSIILLGWEFVVSILTFVVFGTNIKSSKPITYIVCKVILVLIATSGVLALLLQLGASQRSLAEAWLESTRSGAPFGFFSFFSAQLYAALLFVAVYATSVRKYITSICIALAVNLLCAAIIFGNQILLISSCVFVIIPLFRKKQWQKFLVPVLTASILASLCALAGVKEKMPVNAVSVDMSEVMSVIAPEFPLMVHIPGYGYSTRSAKPTNSVTLSPRTIFSVQGKPHQILYFADNRLKKWNGTNWNKLYQDNTDVNVKVLFYPETDSSFTESNMQRVSLTLEDDFFSIVPLMKNTVAVQLPNKLKDSELTGMDGDSISVMPTITKGTKITLFNSLEDSNKELATEYYLSTFMESDVTKKIRSLAISLGLENVTDDTQTQKTYILKVLEYLQEGFTYSLRTPASPTDVDPFEYFLFTSKTGFCSWYAGSFTLLMQAANIPCRVAEGYRVSLDSRGTGKICGTNAHSWAEVYIDGAWRIFEPTPIYTATDPFAYINENDKRTQKLVANSIELEEKIEIPQNNKVLFQTKIKNYISLFITSAILFFVFILLKSRSVVQKARRYVRRYQKKGIAIPQEIGWLMWKKLVAESSHTSLDKKYAKKAIQVADELMKRTYCN